MTETSKRYTSDEQLTNWFSHHPPANASVAVAHSEIRSLFLIVARNLNNLLPEGPDKIAAFRSLRDAMYAANACLACNATDTYPDEE